jgi:hypothetical protein
MTTYPGWNNDISAMAKQPPHHLAVRPVMPDTSYLALDADAIGARYNAGYVPSTDMIHKSPAAPSPARRKADALRGAMHLRL